MRKLGILILGICLISGRLFASSNNFDIFGVDDKTQQKIFLSCSEMMKSYLIFTKKLNKSTTNPSLNDLIHKEKLEKEIINKIKKIDNFALAKISVVYYPSDQKNFATLDLVRVGDTERLPKNQQIAYKNKIIKSESLKQLFREWNKYNNKNMKLLRKKQVDFSKKSCPVMHCTWGFDNIELKEILPKLQDGVAKHKKELIEIIKNSSDEQEREQAIFILANDNNYQEVANYLIDFTDDPSDFVRNNVMRVLGAIVEKHKVEHLNIQRIIKALNYPYVTDRNKAAYVLLGIVKREPATHATVINQAGQTLFELLKLKQPNNHDFAYQILKVISHKNFREHDYINWNLWIKEQQYILSKTKR